MLKRPFRLRQHQQQMAAVVVLMGLLLGPSGCTMWPEGKAATWKNATGIENMEQLFWKAMKEKDWANVESHLASEYHHVSAEGVYDKQQTVAILKTFTLDDYSLGEFTVTSHGDVATVSYIATYRFTDKGKQVGPMTQRYMNTWQKQKSGWVAISSAETPVTGH